jgi:hypothetical protein
VFTFIFVLMICGWTGSASGDGYLDLIGESGTVIVDGDTTCVGVLLGPLDEGTHHLTYLPIQDERLWEMPLLSLSLNLVEGETLSVDVGKLAPVWIKSEPTRCDIYRGGVWIGRTPIVLSTLRDHPDTLTLTKNGYLTTRICPETPAEKENDFNTCVVKLIPDNANGYPAYSSNEGDKNKKEALIKYGSLAASITAMSLGFWYKSRADSYYEDYLSHGDPETVEQLYRKSVELDDRARIFWIAGEVGAIFTSYLFLKDFIFPSRDVKNVSSKAER